MVAFVNFCEYFKNLYNYYYFFLSSFGSYNSENMNVSENTISENIVKTFFNLS